MSLSFLFTVSLDITSDVIKAFRQNEGKGSGQRDSSWTLFPQTVLVLTLTGASFVWGSGERTDKLGTVSARKGLSAQEVGGQLNKCEEGVVTVN